MHATRPIGTRLVLAALVALAACTGGTDGPSREAPASGRTEPSPAPTGAPSVGASDGGAASPSAAGTTDAEPSAAAFDDPLLNIELTDVRDGSTFTLAELAADGPVLIETMAIWCTNCRSQMREITAAHDLAEFHSVSIDVDPTEIPDDLAAYSEREGFDWPFVMADASLATTLRERFGNEVLLPPGMPKILVRPDGSVELLPIGRFLTAAEVAELVGG